MGRGDFRRIVIEGQLFPGFDQWLFRFRPFVNLDMAEHTHHANRKQHSIEKKVESDGFRREFVTVFEEVDNVAE